MAAFGEEFTPDQHAVAKALAASRHLGRRSGRRFLVFDATNGEKLTPEPVTEADPLFAAYVVVRSEKERHPSLDSLTERVRITLLDSYRLGKRIRVEYVDTVPPGTVAAPDFTSVTATPVLAA